MGTLMHRSVELLGKSALAMLLAFALIPSAGFIGIASAEPSDETQADEAQTDEVQTSSNGGSGGLSDYDAIAQAEADGECAPGQALVVYHASGAPKGATGDITVQSESDPLSDAGFGAEQTWDLSEADSADSAAAAACDGALSVQTSDGSTLASGSDVRVALVERDDMSVADLVASLEAIDCVECAQPNYTIEQYAIPTDPYNAQQYSLSGTDTAVVGVTTGVDASAAFDAEAKSGTKENVVAVLDDGVDYTNPDLADQMWDNPGDLGLGPAGTHGYNGSTGAWDPMPGDSHGTHCAGIIAAQTGNGTGVSSVAGANSHTKIMGLRYDNDTGGDFFSGVVGCYEYLVKAKLAGVNLVAVSCSWGSSNGAAYVPVLDYLINQAGKAGVLSCFAAGNEARDAYNYHDSSMLESPYCIEVSSSNRLGQLSSFTTYQETGDDIAAPGSAILSTVPNDSATEYFNAMLTARSGAYDAETNPNGKADKLDYYTDIASILDQTSTQGESDLKIVLTDLKRASLGDAAQAALSYQVTTDGALPIPQGQKSIKITVDCDRLIALGIDPASACVDISWMCPNPFKGTSGLEASDYSASITLGESGYGSTQYVRGLESLFDSAGTDLLAEISGVAVNNDSCESAGGSFVAMNTTDDTLSANLLVNMADGQGALTGSQSCLITGFGIGRATDPTVDEDSAFVPYGYMSGTSMATPLVAGCVAELAALYPYLSPLQLRGRICGGTTPFESEQDRDKIASGGRFTFENALEGSPINANTWSITTSGTSITVHGYALDDAELFVDQGSTPVTVTSQTTDEITFTADSALFDGASHRFDVTDTGTGRTYKAAYVVPDKKADSLIYVRELPDETNAGIFSLVSATDRLFCADGRGSYLYSCTDPSSATGGWTKLKAPGIPWSGAGDYDVVPMAFAYADGRLYAFASHDAPASDGSAQMTIYCSIYDIAKDTWTAWTEAGHDRAMVCESLSACAVDGTVCCLAVRGDLFYSANSAVLVTCASGQETFAQSDVTLPAGYNLPCAIHAISGRLYGFIEPTQKDGDATYQAYLASCDPTTAALTTVGALEAYGSSSDYFLVRGLLTRVQTAAGNGIVIAGQSAEGYGDLQLIGADASVTGLGSYGVEPAASGLSVGAMTMYDGKLYIGAIDLAADEDTLGTDASGAADATDTLDTAATGTNIVDLYTLPDDAADELESTDVTLTAEVSSTAAGTATVADWRGAPASSISVRRGDKATWTAAPLAGYTFSGWYDEDGRLVSTSATYSDLATEARSLVARFAAGTGTAYTVDHYLQALDGSYATTPDATDSLTGTTGESTAAVARSYTGFTAQTFEQTAIAGDGSTVVKIYYARNTHTLTIVYAGPSDATFVTPATYMKTLRYGTVYDVATPVVAGYTPDSDTVAGRMGDADVTSVVTYAQIAYTVAFNANAKDATGSMADEAFAYGAAKALTANSFTRSGYTFAGWNTQADGKGTSYTDAAKVKNLTTVSGGKVTLYAQWTPISKGGSDSTGTSGGNASTYTAKTGDTALPLMLVILSLIAGGGAVLLSRRLKGR